MNQVAKHWKDYECIDAGSGENAGAMEGYHTAPSRSAGDLADGGKPACGIHRMHITTVQKGGGGSWEYKNEIQG